MLGTRICVKRRIRSLSLSCCADIGSPAFTSYILKLMTLFSFYAFPLTPDVMAARSLTSPCVCCVPLVTTLSSHNALYIAPCSCPVHYCFAGVYVQGLYGREDIAFSCVRLGLSEGIGHSENRDWRLAKRPTSRICTRAFLVANNNGDEMSTCRRAARRGWESGSRMRDRSVSQVPLALSLGPPPSPPPPPPLTAALSDCPLPLTSPHL